MAGGLPRWLGGRKEEPLPAPDPDEEVPQLPEGLDEDIRSVERAALEIYSHHGLPTQAGGYAQRGFEAAWEKLPDDLTPQEKWSLMDEAPEGAGWRFVERSAIGRTHPETEVRRASVLLAACEGLRARLSGRIPTTAQDVVDALQLGAASAWLAGAGSGNHPMASPDAEVKGDERTPLVFFAVSDAHDAD